ncbi:unnamed protein product [Phytomonas sp. Hart1]|nr:unnamed protein product [Phytomonas sp. Hart1]|eukprot:CCW68364.1 unnamed protein product [Phytomonas sp. isolate Hart1]
MPYVDLVSCMREQPREFISLLRRSLFIRADWARNPQAYHSPGETIITGTMLRGVSSSVDGQRVALPGDSPICSTVFIRLLYNFTRMSDGGGWCAAAISIPERDVPYNEVDSLVNDAGQTHRRDSGEAPSGNTFTLHRNVDESNCEDYYRLSGDQFFEMSHMVMREDFFAERFAGFCSFTPFLHPPFLGGCFVRFVSREDALQCLEWMRSQPGFRQLFLVQMARQNSIVPLAAYQHGMEVDTEYTTDF